MSHVVEPDRQSYAIVVLGDFNPSIFQPLWFSANELLPKEEVDEADIAVIHKEIASFSVGKLHVQVDQGRLGLTTVESSHGPVLRDLAIGTLSILEHTPLKAIGLNRDMNFVAESQDAWHAIGHRIVPKTDWSEVLESPGTSQVVVQGKRTACVADRVSIRIQPSPNNGVLVAINQHYQLESPQRIDVRERHREALRVLRDDWNPFVNYARAAALKLLHLEPSDKPSSEAQ